MPPRRAHRRVAASGGKGEGKGEKWREGRERERDAREEQRRERGEGPPVVLLLGGGAARAASVPTASGTFDVRLQRFASSLSRDVYLCFGSVRTQNASPILRLRCILGDSELCYEYRGDVSTVCVQTCPLCL